PDAVSDLTRVRRLKEGEAGDIAQSQRGHLQDDRSQVGAQDLGVRELGSGLEILLGVQPDADPVRDTTTAPSALACTGPGDRLDREALHLGALAVSRDTGGPGVHDI